VTDIMGANLDARENTEDGGNDVCGEPDVGSRCLMATTAEFGGSFVPEVLHETLVELREAFDDAQHDPSFWSAYVDLMSSYAGRPTPVTYCENLTREFGGRADLPQAGRPESHRRT